MKIAVDVMGGDYAPTEIIAGAVKWAQERQSQVCLVGTQSIINKNLKDLKYNPDLVEVVNATQVITMDESPALALRKKKDASIVIATHLVKEGVCDAVLSCGSTGAQMAAAIFILGRLKGVERPPIVAAIPNSTGGSTLLMDVGANVDCKPQQLLQFALLGRAYASFRLGVDNPKVALLNNGEEETKGSNLYVETYHLLKRQPELNFMGNIEGRDLFAGKSDVIVCDGFTGNILLKTVEGLAIFMAKSLSQEIGYLPTFFQKIDYTKIGGAPLLGVNGVSVVCHGSSRRETVASGLSIAADCVVNEMIKKQEAELVNLG